MEKHAKKFQQLGLNIAYYRKLRGLSQMALSEKVHISRTHLSQIEAPNMKKSFSISTLLILQRLWRLRLLSCLSLGSR